jgi:hypothetical protein
MPPAQRGRLRRLTADAPNVSSSACSQAAPPGQRSDASCRSILRHLQDDLVALHRVVLHPIDLRRGSVDIAGKQSSAVDPDIADAKQSIRERRRTFGLAPLILTPSGSTNGSTLAWSSMQPSRLPAPLPLVSGRRERLEVSGISTWRWRSTAMSTVISRRLPGTQRWPPPTSTSSIRHLGVA